MANTININVNKTDLGLDQVNNTSDVNKPISTATQTALNGKEDVSNKSTDVNLGTSNTLYPTQNAVKTYTDNLLGNANALIYKGVIDCSTNPNYPSANAGELYIISVAGKIGGGSGIDVEVGDMLICNTDSTISGNQSTVGSYWNAIQKNIDGYVNGPSTSVNNNIALFDGTTGKIIKDSGIAINATSNYITKKDLVGNIVNSLFYDNGTFIGLGVTDPKSLYHVSTANKTVHSSLITTEHVTLSHEVGSSGFNAIVSSNDSQGHRGVYKSTRTRGTLDTPLAVSNGDVIASYVGAGYDGTQILNSAGITFEVDGVVTTNNVPQSIILATGVNTRTERMRIDSSGNTTVTGNISATNLSGTNTGDQDLSSYATKDLTLDRKTASYTLVAGDNNKLIEMNVGSANNVTINNSVFTAGNQILVSQYGAGQVTFVAGSGVTLRSPSGKLKLTGQFSLATIIAISATEFYISGDLTA
jgi:hypothetical protein